MHLYRGLKGKAQTWSGLRPVKQNIPIWSVMWAQLWVDPEDTQQDATINNSAMFQYSSLFFFTVVIAFQDFSSNKKSFPSLVVKHILQSK